MIKDIKCLLWVSCARFWVAVGNLVEKNDKLWTFAAKRAYGSMLRAYSYIPYDNPVDYLKRQATISQLKQALSLIERGEICD